MARHGENIYRRKDGRYEGRYVIGKKSNGATRFGYVYGYQYQKVRNELMRRKLLIAENLSRMESDMLFESWMDQWLEEELRFRVKLSSYQTYVRQYKKHILPVFVGRHLRSICCMDAAHLIERLEACGLADATIRSIYRLFSAGMCSAQEEGLISKNPCRKIRLQARKHEEQRVLSAKEQKSFHRAAMDGGETASLLALYTGMRLGEVCALRFSDIDWQQRTISVRRTAQRVLRSGGGTMLMIGSPKSQSSCRTLPLPEFLLCKLRELFAGRCASEYIFGNSQHAAEPRTLQRRFQRIAESAGVTGAHFHTLRHSFATRLIESGVNVKTVSAMLGHQSAQTTLDFYAHSFLEDRRRAIESLAGCMMCI